MYLFEVECETEFYFEIKFVSANFNDNLKIDCRISKNTTATANCIMKFRDDCYDWSWIQPLEYNQIYNSILFKQ